MKRLAATAVVWAVGLVLVWWTGVILRGSDGTLREVPVDLGAGGLAVAIAWVTGWAFRELGT